MRFDCSKSVPENDGDLRKFRRKVKTKLNMGD